MVGPIAGVLLMFYNSYEQYQGNREDLEELLERVDYCKIWLESSANAFKGLKASDLDAMILVSYKKLNQAVHSAGWFVKRLNGRLKGTGSSGLGQMGNVLAGVFFSSVDQEELQKRIGSINQAMADFGMSLSAWPAFERWKEKERAERERAEKLLDELRTELKPLLFDNVVREKVKQFFSKSGCRQWVFDVVEDWMTGGPTRANPQPSEDSKDVQMEAAVAEREERKGLADLSSKVFWLRADAGMGKTVLAAKIADVFRKKERLLAAVFFKFNNAKETTAEMMVRSIAYQIASHFRDIDMMEDMLRFTKELRYQSESGPRDIREMCKKLMLSPLKMMGEKKGTGVGSVSGPLLIVVDALDEVSVNRQDLLDFLSFDLMESLPPQIKFLYTSRPEVDITETLEGFRPFSIHEDDPRHQADLRLFIESQLSGKLQESLLSRATDMMMEKSEGRFVYIGLVASDISSWPNKLKDWSKVEKLLDKLANGVSGVYSDFFSKTVTDFESHRNFLRIMVGSYEPLSMAEIEVLLEDEEEGVDGKRSLEKSRAELSRLFLSRREEGEEEDAEGGESSVGAKRRTKITPYHKSIVDWLSDRKKSSRFFIAVEDSRELLLRWIVQRCLEVSLEELAGMAGEEGGNRLNDCLWKGLRSSSEDGEDEEEGSVVLRGYLLNHLCDHLDAAGYEDVCLMLLTSLPWLQARASQGGGRIGSLVADYMKRVSSSTWLRGTGGGRAIMAESQRDLLRQEFVFIFDFLRLIVNAEEWIERKQASGGGEEVCWEREMCTQITGRFQQYLLSHVTAGQLKGRSSRIRRLVGDAFEWLSKHGGYAILSSDRKLVQVGGSLYGLFLFNGCQVVSMTNNLVVVGSRQEVVFLDTLSCTEVARRISNLDCDVIETDYFSDRGCRGGMMAVNSFLVLRCKYQLCVYFVDVNSRKWKSVGSVNLPIDSENRRWVRLNNRRILVMFEGKSPTIVQYIFDVKTMTLRESHFKCIDLLWEFSTPDEDNYEISEEVIDYISRNFYDLEPCACRLQTDNFVGRTKRSFQICRRFKWNGRSFLFLVGIIEEGLDSSGKKYSVAHKYICYEIDINGCLTKQPETGPCQSFIEGQIDREVDYLLKTCYVNNHVLVDNYPTPGMVRIDSANILFFRFRMCVAKDTSILTIASEEQVRFYRLPDTDCEISKLSVQLTCVYLVRSKRYLGVFFVEGLEKAFYTIVQHPTDLYDYHLNSLVLDTLPSFRFIKSADVTFFTHQLVVSQCEKYLFCNDAENFIIVNLKESSSPPLIIAVAVKGFVSICILQQSETTVCCVSTTKSSKSFIQYISIQSGMFTSRIINGIFLRGFQCHNPFQQETIIVLLFEHHIIVNQEKILLDVEEEGEGKMLTCTIPPRIDTDGNVLLMFLLTPIQSGIIDKFELCDQCVYEMNIQFTLLQPAEVQCSRTFYFPKEIRLDENDLRGLSADKDAFEKMFPEENFLVFTRMVDILLETEAVPDPDGPFFDYHQSKRKYAIRSANDDPTTYYDSSFGCSTVCMQCARK